MNQYHVSNRKYSSDVLIAHRHDRQYLITKSSTYAHIVSRLVLMTLSLSLDVLANEMIGYHSVFSKLK